MIEQAIIAVVASVFCGELVKTITGMVRHERFNFGQLGGMPSTHSAAVAALASSVYAEQGFSMLFLVVLVFGVIVIRDAYGVRWEVTRHSTALNKLTKSADYGATGHTRLQVLCGIALGVLVTVLVYAVL